MGFIIAIGEDVAMGDTGVLVQKSPGWVELRRESFIVGICDDPTWREPRTLEYLIEDIDDLITALQEARDRHNGKKR